MRIDIDIQICIVEIQEQTKLDIYIYIYIFRRQEQTTEEKKHEGTANMCTLFRRPFRGALFDFDERTTGTATVWTAGSRSLETLRTAEISKVSVVKQPRTRMFTCYIGSCLSTMEKVAVRSAFLDETCDAKQLEVQESQVFCWGVSFRSNETWQFQECERQQRDCRDLFETSLCTPVISAQLMASTVEMVVPQPVTWVHFQFRSANFVGKFPRVNQPSVAAIQV